MDVIGMVNTHINATSTSGEQFHRTSKVYMVSNVDECFLSWDVLRGLKIIDANFPEAGGRNRISTATTSWAGIERELLFTLFLLPDMDGRFWTLGQKDTTAHTRIRPAQRRTRGPSTSSTTGAKAATRSNPTSASRGSDRACGCTSSGSQTGASHQRCSATPSNSTGPPLSPITCSSTGSSPVTSQQEVEDRQPPAKRVRPRGKPVHSAPMRPSQGASSDSRPPNISWGAVEDSSIT